VACFSLPRHYINVRPVAEGFPHSPNEQHARPLSSKQRRPPLRWGRVRLPALPQPDRRAFLVGKSSAMSCCRWCSGGKHAKSAAWSCSRRCMQAPTMRACVLS
jgi:hypothetical protein